jgi:predicted hydrolase (HD superfamily)
MAVKPDFTRDEALALLKEYNNEDFHLQHAYTVEGVMRYFARSLGYGEDEDFWAQAGLLHDLDFELYPGEHCVKVQSILRERGAGEALVRAVASHGWGLSGSEYAPEHEMEKALFAADELTGLIWACAIIRPSKSVRDLELKSVKKKYKSPNFAAGCSRETISKGAEMMGWDLDRLITETILAMRSCEDDVNDAMARP